MKILLALAVGASMTLAGCSSVDYSSSTESPASDSAMQQAESDLKMAQKMGAEWRVVDKATGKKSAALSSLLAAANKAAEAGNQAEADRIAAAVSRYAKMGIAQAEQYQGTKPYFNN